jgi:hypothetical protein
MILTAQPLRDTSCRIKVNHVFECKGCHLYWLGGELYKGRSDGKRKCKRCFHEVEDITFTETAQQWLFFSGVSPIEERK